MIRKFISQIDGAEIEYQFNGENLEIRPTGCDWSDFIPEDKRAYSKPEYEELMSLLKIVRNEHLILSLPKLASDCLNILEDVI